MNPALAMLRHHVTGAVERGEADPIPGYLPIAGGYSYAPLRVGLVVRNPAGQDVYVQPGDDEAAMRETIEALGELDVTDDKRALVTDMTLGEYFA